MVPQIDKVLKGGKVGVFCGAGTSLNSGIPLVADIIETVLKALAVADSDIYEFKAKKIPFETFMEILLTHTNGNSLFKIFAGGKPRRNHKFLANLAKKGLVKHIITTNFDVLIEQALSEEGVAFKVYSEDDQLKEWTDINDVQIIKLHGCISNTGTLLTTISNVAHQLRASVRKKLIQKLLSGNIMDYLLIMGYSRSDKFDINPAVSKIRSSLTNVLLIEHSPKNKASNSISPIKNNPEADPFSSFSGAVIKADTDEFVKKHWKLILSSPTQPDRAIPIDWNKYVEEWRAEAVLEFGDAILPLIAALIFKSANLYEISNSYAKKVIEGLPSFESSKLLSLALQTIGDNYRDKGDYDEALLYLRKAIVSSHRLKCLKGKARAITSIGIVFEDIAKYRHNEAQRKQAVKCYLLGKAWSETISDLELQGKCEGNLGILYKNMKTKEYLQTAIMHLKASLKIARRIGDKKSEGRMYGSLGSAFSLLNKKRNGFRFYNRAKAIADDLGDSLHVGIWTANTGEDLINIDPALAIEHIENAISIFNSLQQPHYVTYCKSLLERMSSENKSITAPTRLTTTVTLS